MGERFIGELGTARESADISFGYFGQKIRVGAGASDLEFVEFMDRASTIDELNEVEATKAVMGYLRKLVHPEDWETFWAAAKANGQQLVDLLSDAQKILEAVAGFPTGQPAASSRGRSRTSRKSKDASSSARRAMQLLEGRPDLQMAVVHAQEARAAEAAG